jgi:hypothetical protein
MYNLQLIADNVSVSGKGFGDVLFTPRRSHGVSALRSFL